MKKVKQSEKPEGGRTSVYSTGEKQIEDNEKQTDIQAGCATSSFLILICIFTLLILLFAGAILYRGML